MTNEVPAAVVLDNDLIADQLPIAARDDVRDINPAPDFAVRTRRGDVALTAQAS